RRLISRRYFGMNVIIHRRIETEFRSATLEQAALESESVLCRFEFRFETVNQRIQVLEMDLSICVLESAGVLFWSGVKRRLEFEVVKIRIQRTLLIVVIDLTLPDVDVTDTQIEHARALIRTLRFREIGFAIVGDINAGDRMIQHDVFQIPVSL